MKSRYEPILKQTQEAMGIIRELQLPMPWVRNIVAIVSKVSNFKIILKKTELNASVIDSQQDGAMKFKRFCFRKNWLFRFCSKTFLTTPAMYIFIHIELNPFSYNT